MLQELKVNNLIITNIHQERSVTKIITMVSPLDVKTKEKERRSTLDFKVRG